MDELILTNLILPIVKDIIAPKISEIIDKYSIKNLSSVKIEEQFEEYLLKRYERFLVIDTLAFPNKQTLFETIYEPLTITDGNDFEPGSEILIDKYPENFIPYFCRAIIEDTAGMGKSTISKKLFLSIVEQKAGIPILIELRHLSSRNRILKEIQKQISPIGKVINQESILKLINEGDFIFLFDGFDEIANDNRDYVIKEIHSFIEKANHNYFLITSRYEECLTSFGDFQRFKIRNLKKEEAHSLIRRYDTYSYKPIGEDLIRILEEKNDSNINEYLSNPLLVSLLYKSFDFKKDIPLKKSQFYRQVYDALFETHDLSKEGYLKREKYSKLHIDDFERVLRYVGFFTAIENRVEFEKNYIINIIEKSKRHLVDLNFKSSDFLKDLLNTVPLFKKEGNSYRWSHKSLQDYFTAKFIWIDAKERQEKILMRIYNEPNNSRFYNILDIFYELDPITFDSTITHKLVEDFLNFANDKLGGSLPNISKDKLILRIEQTFCRKNQLIVSKPEDYDAFLEDEEKSERIYEYYSKKTNSKEVNGGVGFHYFKSPRVILFNFKGIKRNIETILRIVHRTNPRLIKNVNTLHNHEKLIQLKSEVVYNVDFSEANILNSIELFDIITESLDNQYTISYSEAVKEIKRIKKSKEYGNELSDW